LVFGLVTDYAKRSSIERVGKTRVGLTDIATRELYGIARDAIEASLLGELD